MSSLKLKLTLAAKPSDIKINHGHKVMMIGSCFTENMGVKLNDHLFETLQNPHGILFNPVSGCNALMDYVTHKQYAVSDLFYLNEVWNSWHHHSRYSAVQQAHSLQKINNGIQKAHQFLKSAHQLIITLGSAWLYTLNDNAPDHKGLIVANNHKAPSNWFSKQLMSADELTKHLTSLVSNLNSFNPNLKIIFTISPVRHLREGLVENNRSKAVLIQAVHHMVANHKMLAYFPAYEYVVDDLRDYRFYAEDLVHPNYAATQYVWEQFVETYMNADTQTIMKQVAELQLAMHHKPLNSMSTEHQKFLKSCLEKTITLKKQYPFLPLESHVQYFSTQIGE